MLDTPKTAGFSMPAEWEEHSAVWLAWPHDTISFGSLNEPKGKTVKGRLKKVEQKFAEAITAIVESEPVELIVLDPKMKTRVEKLLLKAGVDVTKITFHLADYADVWTRDYRTPVYYQSPHPRTGLDKMDI